jgi:hypothetical protein
MSSILSKKYNVSFICETHKQSVSYLSTQINQIATREISDLWIVVFSPLRGKARMTFLQAKKHTGILNQYHRVFSGDYYQYELLSQRSVLTRVIGQRFNFPQEILSFSCCSSIGSYGVFFNDNNKIDLAYSSAAYLKTNSVLPTTYRQFPIDLEIPFLTNKHPIVSPSCNVCTELISCFDIDTFTQSLLALEIGGELTYYPEIFASVIGIIQQQNISSGIDIAANQLIDFAYSFLGQNLDNNSGLDGQTPTNIMIINTDEKITNS